jgi:hypothetical protein
MLRFCLEAAGSIDDSAVKAEDPLEELGVKLFDLPLLKLPGTVELKDNVGAGLGSENGLSMLICGAGSALGSELSRSELLAICTAGSWLGSSIRSKSSILFSDGEGNSRETEWLGSCVNLIDSIFV